jgi:hypothetical protein
MPMNRPYGATDEGVITRTIRGKTETSIAVLGDDQQEYVIFFSAPKNAKNGARVRLKWSKPAGPPWKPWWHVTVIG